jgi:hypothetical protein
VDYANGEGLKDEGEGRRTGKAEEDGSGSEHSEVREIRKNMYNPTVTRKRLAGDSPTAWGWGQVESRKYAAIVILSLDLFTVHLTMFDSHRYSHNGMEIRQKSRVMCHFPDSHWGRISNTKNNHVLAKALPPNQLSSQRQPEMGRLNSDREKDKKKNHIPINQ